MDVWQLALALVGYVRDQWVLLAWTIPVLAGCYPAGRMACRSFRRLRRLKAAGVNGHLERIARQNLRRGLLSLAMFAGFSMIGVVAFFPPFPIRSAFTMVTLVCIPALLSANAWLDYRDDRFLGG